MHVYICQHCHRELARTEDMLDPQPTCEDHPNGIVEIVEDCDGDSVNP